MIWFLLILVPGIMFHLLPLTTLTFCTTWLVLTLADSRAFTGKWVLLCGVSVLTLMLFAIRCIAILIQGA